MVCSLLQVIIGTAAKAQVESIKVRFAVTINLDNKNHRNQDMLCMQHFFLDTSLTITKKYQVQYIQHLLLTVI